MRAGLGRRSAAAYLVVESLYDDYGTTPHGPPRDWPDGERSPGVLTVALIHRPEGLEYREWITRWHGTQSPVSAELQPRTRYVRNEVVRSLSDGAPEVDGIVEEAWPSTGHVADPMLFFNATTPEELDANVARMIASVDACLDLGRLRSSTMSEYLIKSAGLRNWPGRRWGTGSTGPAGGGRVGVEPGHRKALAPRTASAPITYALALVRRGDGPHRHRRKHPWDCPSASSVSPMWGSRPSSTP